MPFYSTILVGCVPRPKNLHIWPIFRFIIFFSKLSYNKQNNYRTVVPSSTVSVYDFILPPYFLSSFFFPLFRLPPSPQLHTLAINLFHPSSLCYRYSTLPPAVTPVPRLHSSRLLARSPDVRRLLHSRRPYVSDPPRHRCVPRPVSPLSVSRPASTRSRPSSWHRVQFPLCSHTHFRCSRFADFPALPPVLDRSLHTFEIQTVLLGFAAKACHCILFLLQTSLSIPRPF